MSASLKPKTSDKSGLSPLERFSSAPIRPKVSHFRPFGCPVYVLKGKIQSGQKGPKWESQARVGIYLGPSPVHARSVALVLNVTTGLASPQFHVKFDNLFETVRDIKDRISWMSATHFVIDKTAPPEILTEPTIPTVPVPPIPDVTTIQTPSPRMSNNDMPVSEGATTPDVPPNVTGDTPEIDNQRHEGEQPTGPAQEQAAALNNDCLLYTSPSPRDGATSRMPSSA